MMMKGFGLDESMMSNLTSTLSNETSISSNTRNESSSTTTTMLYPQASPSSAASPNQGQLPPPPPPPPAKKKRSLPGNPDPDAEVIALSPKSLLATNRFICEICNKGFQRDQNLQLHRRGHNLPWKLKQRPKGELIRKKVYVCPEPNCAHHDPSRALGDLTGIKKHFCRKHGEKKWKCDKCSKKYAVQSDWKAHSKICGTKEYRCDCGTLFSRRDSFITHRAFCDALVAVELPQSSYKTDHVSFPPWLSSPPPQQLQPAGPHLFAAPQISASALLQKAAEMGVTIASTSIQNDPHATGGGGRSSSSTSAAGMCSSRDLHDMMLMHSTSAAGGGFGDIHERHQFLYNNNNNIYNNNNSEGNQGVMVAPGGGNPPQSTAFNGGGGGGGDGLSTRDFLGMRRITQNDLINMAAEQLRAQINSPANSTNTSFDHHHHQRQLHHDHDHHQHHDHQNQNQNPTPW